MTSAPTNTGNQHFVIKKIVPGQGQGKNIPFIIPKKKPFTVHFGKEAVFLNHPLHLTHTTELNHLRDYHVMKEDKGCRRTFEASSKKEKLMRSYKDINVEDK